MLNLLNPQKTAYKKANLTSCPEVCIAGDPIVDIYLEDVKNKICDGGVLNVINNYKYFSDKKSLLYFYLLQNLISIIIKK